MSYEIDEATLYYFLCPFEDRYYTLFIGMLRPELIQAFKEMEQPDGHAIIRIKIGEHQFISVVDRPVFVVEYDCDQALEFAGDAGQLTLFANGSPEDTDLPPVIEFPTYWTGGIEPMLQFKLGSEFCANEHGVWVPLDITERGGAHE